jgi:hypothetical protein
MPHRHWQRAEPTMICGMGHDGDEQRASGHSERGNLSSSDYAAYRRTTVAHRTSRSFTRVWRAPDLDNDGAVDKPIPNWIE